MNWADLLAPRYHLACRPGGSVHQTGQDAWEQRLLGFDRQTLRFVTIHTLPPLSLLPHPVAQSIGERVYLAGRIAHPGLFNLTDYGERQGCLFYVTELEEGEPLPFYLGRVRALPLPYAIDLAVQFVALLRHLAAFPRILGNVTADELLVSLSPGLSLSLRLAGLGLNREEPQEPQDIQKKWLPQAASLLWDIVGVSVGEDQELKFSARGSSVLLDPFRSFLDSAGTPSSRPAAQVFRELERDLHHYLRGFLSLWSSSRHPLPSEECIPLRPKSFLASLLMDEGVLSHWHDHNFEFAPELYCSHSRFAFAVRDVRKGSDLTFQVLPSSSAMGETGLENLYRKLSLSGLGEDTPLLRALFLRGQTEYTLFAEEAIHGFNLVSLLEHRSVLTSNETYEILKDLGRAFDHLEGITSIAETVAPWNVYVTFPPRSAGDGIPLPLHSSHLRSWPSFRLRIRLGPTTADFTRPVRCEWDEILRQLQSAFPSPGGGFHHLDLSFAALALYLLEYRRYHNRLVSNDPRSRAVISCAKLHRLFAASLLSGQPHSPELRQGFLRDMAAQLESLAYPRDPISSLHPTPEISHFPADAAESGSSRKLRVTFLRKLLLRESRSHRLKHAKPAK